jgi:thermostable 8-oxoguanine DNA glycosylase
MVDLAKYASMNFATDLEDRLFKVVGPDARKRGFLTLAELVEIGRWKLDRLFAPKHERAHRSNAEDLVTAVTQVAFGLDDVMAVTLLAVLKGVGVPVASAVLAVVFPEKFGVIDQHAWKALHSLGLVAARRKGDSFTPGEYGIYMQEVRKLAAQHDMTPRRIDLALYWYDKDEKPLRRAEGRLQP